VALYAAVQDAIHALIKDRELAPGDALPPEQELQAIFGVSRATIRQALSQLEQRRIVERHQGKGTFLAIPTMELSLPQLTGFSEQVRTRGMRPSSRLVEYADVTQTGDRDAHFFPTGTALVRMVRIRCANDVPIGTHAAILPVEVAERAGLSEARLRTDPSFSLYARLEAAGVRITWAEEYLRSRGADKAEADLLNVRAGTPVMEVLRLTRRDGDRLMEVVRSVLLGDRYTYIVYLERHPATAGLGGLVTHAREEEVARR
jgi:GntR family transcriptional regulator